MDLQQAKILLEKINALHKSVSLDGGEVSNIERDLMLSYIRQFYEAYLNTDTSAAPQPMSRTVAPPPPAPPVERTISEPLPPRVEVEPAPAPPPPKPAPVVEVPAPPPAPKPEPVVEVPAPAPAPAKKTASSGVEALFKHKAAKELSEKLSQQAITDLTRAMSINDKLLYSNELFGRDMAAMNETLQQLNKLNSMEEARELLIDIAETNDWTEEERTDVAESFIKLVRRKY
jgi:outer membrane biosynthesis protein TonB